MNNTVAVVVTFNRKVLLKECIEALLSLEKDVCDVLIIDNASTDNTREYIAEYIDSGKILYHNTGENLGGAGGFHVGMKLAVEKGYSYVWIMDDDTIVQKDTLHQLMEADRKLNGNYGFLSSIAYWTDGSICNMNRQRVSMNGMLENFDGDMEQIIMATFVSFFVKADMIREVGLPISEFFIWADDLEYSRRISMKKPGYAVLQSKVLHKMGSNAKVGIEHEAKDRLWRYQYLYRNEVYVFGREGLKGYIYLFMRVALHCVRVILKSKEAKMDKLKVLLSSFFSGFSFHPEVKYVDEVK